LKDAYTNIYIDIHPYNYNMQEITTIRLSKELVAELAKLKVHPRESYNDVIVRLMYKRLVASGAISPTGTVITPTSTEKQYTRVSGVVQSSATPMESLHGSMEYVSHTLTNFDKKD
jgi:hypothetical protein